MTAEEASVTVPTRVAVGAWAKEEPPSMTKASRRADTVAKMFLMDMRGMCVLPDDLESVTVPARTNCGNM
jgi:hypothetical protein